MPALDFKEIASAQSGENRDSFELFARDCLELMGFEIVKGPSRGPDDGIDLHARELRKGPGGTSVINWLVSCKHKAASGKSVLSVDEVNLRDRIETHGCTGFIAFYSTVASSGLATVIEGLRQKYEILVLDPEKIEAQLLASAQGRVVVGRYMPRSLERWIPASQRVEAPVSSVMSIVDKYFLREPHGSIHEALVEAKARSLPVFVVVYDREHPLRSSLDYYFGNFMSWHATKRLVDQHFVPAIGDLNDPGFHAIVPSGDPMEQCRWGLLDSDGKLLQGGRVHGNPSDSYELIKKLVGK